MICLVILRIGFWKKSFVCLHALLFCHLAVQWKSISFLISFLKKVVGRGSQGSGPGALFRARFWPPDPLFRFLGCHSGLSPILVLFFSESMRFVVCVDMIA